jgi:hypothetical protein
MYQRRRPKDNNIEFWRLFTADYFVEKATLRFDYMNMATGELRCFEPCMEVLPRLLKVGAPTRGAALCRYALDATRHAVCQSLPC